MLASLIQARPPLISPHRLPASRTAQGKCSSHGPEALIWTPPVRGTFKAFGSISLRQRTHPSICPRPLTKLLHTRAAGSDGFGQGGLGQGGFGQSANTFAWSPGFLPSGVWQFSIIPYDWAGNNRGSGQSIPVTVAVPPRPPASPQVGNRLNDSDSGSGTRQVTLSWLASRSD